MKCANCGTELNDGDAFCIACGTKVETRTETTETPDANDTPERVTEQNIEPQAKQGNPKQLNQEKPPKKKKLGLLIGILVAIVLLAATIVAGVIFVFPRLGIDLFSKQEKESVDFFYVEDNELLLMDIDDIDEDPIELTDDYIDEDVVRDEYGFIYSNLAITDDGKTCYFPSELDSYYEFTLCVARVKNGEAKVDEIDSGVSYFTMLDDGALIYLKSAKLYYYKDDDKTKIASDVEDYFISEDENWIIWAEDEVYDDYGYRYTADYYINRIDGSADDVCLEKGASYQGGNVDFSIIYLLENDDLYKYDREGESDKLASDVSAVYEVDFDHELFYYTEQTDVEINLLDYLDDPYKDEDAGVPAEPQYPNYGDFWDSESGSYDDVAYDDAYDAYWDAWDEWYMNISYDDYDAGVRNGKRVAIETFNTDFYSQKLFYYDGKDATSVVDEFVYFLLYPTEDQYAYVTKEYIVGEKISIDDIYEPWDVYYFIEESSNCKFETTVYANGETETLDEDIYSIWAYEDMMYYVTYNDEETADDYDEYYYYGPAEYTLYSFDLSAKDFGDIEELSDEMNNFEGFMNGVPYYVCNVDEENEEGDLYAGTKEIASDVTMDSVGFLEEDNALLYMTDVDWYEYTFTLVLYMDEDEEELANDVSYFTAQNANCIFFIEDFDWYDYVGELSLYRDGDTEEISDDVNMLYYYGKGATGTYYGTW